MFRLVILTGRDTEATCEAINLLRQAEDTEVAAILYDRNAQPLRGRLRNLRRNLRREGAAYLWFRALDWLRSRLDKRARLIVPEQEVLNLLRRAIPERVFQLQDFDSRFSMPLHQVDSLNNHQARQLLHQMQPDLGVVLGTRILGKDTFSIPRLGCINLHKGKVPEYRGMPPAFWELCEAQKTAGVTVHFVDAGLDSGDLVGEDTVEIHPNETLLTLQKKLDRAGNLLLLRCVEALRRGAITRRPQPASSLKPRTAPTRRQRNLLRDELRLRSQPEDRFVYLPKTLLYLLFHHSGLLRLVRWLRRRGGGARGCVLLYHRVNDVSDDVLTTSPRRFAEQMVLLKNQFRVLSTSELVGKLLAGERLEPTTIAIHFDDCYRDVFTVASRIMRAAELPGCVFVSSGYVDTERVFEHDDAKYPNRYPNFRSGDLVELAGRDFEIGAHTVNHVDLGKCSVEVATREITQSARDLAGITGRPVRFFSFPFGTKRNIQPAVVDLIRSLEFEALFSAYGGYITRRSDPYDLCRIGVSEEHRPLDLLIEIEGLSLSRLAAVWSR